jgi:hypothetical protein
MPKIAYEHKNLSDKKLGIINQANAIIAEYRAQGFTLTLRQLYYQFVARGFIANNQREYAKLGAALSDGRMCGLIDWIAIIDRTRNLQSVTHWTSPTDIVGAVADQYRIDKWAGQTFRPEVWIEKDAVAGVVEGICRELDVPYFSCRGYTSQSEMWVGAMRLRQHVQRGQTPLILHFGDHDPSGKDMTRDIMDRLQTFMGGVELRRLALNWDQIEEFKPPPNPAKFSDPRADAYVAAFGEESWELDALEPSLLVNLIHETILNVRDEDAWQERVEEEETHRDLLTKTSNRWDDVVNMLKDDNSDT